MDFLCVCPFLFQKLIQAGHLASAPALPRLPCAQRGGWGRSGDAAVSTLMFDASACPVENKSTPTPILISGSGWPLQTLCPCSSQRVQKGRGGRVRLPPEPPGAPCSPGVRSSGPGAAPTCPGSGSCPAVRVVCAAFFLFAAHTAGARGWWTRYLFPLAVDLPAIVALPTCFSIYEIIESGARRLGPSCGSVFQVTCPAAVFWMTIRLLPALETPPGEYLSARPVLMLLALARSSRHRGVLS